MLKLHFLLGARHSRTIAPNSSEILILNGSTEIWITSNVLHYKPNYDLDVEASRLSMIFWLLCTFTLQHKFKINCVIQKNHFSCVGFENNHIGPYGVSFLETLVRSRPPAFSSSSSLSYSVSLSFFSIFFSCLSSLSWFLKQCNPYNIRTIWKLFDEP